MLFVDQLKEVLEMALHPTAKTKKKRSMLEAVKFYYKATFLIMLFGIVVLGSFASILISHIAAIGASTTHPVIAAFGSVAPVLIVVLGLVVWLLVPLIEIIGAAIVQLFGKYIFRKFKKTFDKTYVALIYTTNVKFLLYFMALVITVLLFFVSPVLALFGIVLLVGAAIWSIAVEVIALGNQQNIRALTVLWIIIGMIIVIVILEFLIHLAIALL